MNLPQIQTASREDEQPIAAACSGACSADEQARCDVRLRLRSAATADDAFAFVPETAHPIREAA